MHRTTKRSHVNFNNMGHYSLADARLDNPHLPERDVREVFRAEAADAAGGGGLGAWGRTLAGQIQLH